MPRPTNHKVPEHLSKSPPVPEPEEVKTDEALSPTRYGDWEHKGIAVDFS